MGIFEKINLISKTAILEILNIKTVPKVIHLAATTAATIGAGLAQFPGSDSALLIPLQAAMVTQIGRLHGATVTEEAALALLGTFTATAVGRQVSQWLIGWVPGWGNGINAATAAALTEGMGWSADKYFTMRKNKN